MSSWDLPVMSLFPALGLQTHSVYPAFCKWLIGTQAEACTGSTSLAKPSPSYPRSLSYALFSEKECLISFYLIDPQVLFKIFSHSYI